MEHINNQLKNIYKTYFKPMMDKTNNAENYFETILNENYTPPNINYEYESSNKQANNYLKKFDLNDFILNYKKYFINMLNDKLDKSIITIYNYITYFTIIFRDLFTKYKDINLKKIHEWFKKLLYSFQVLIINYNENNNILSPLEKDKFIPYPEVLKILNNLNNNNYKNHILKLLLSLYTLTPPVRNELKEVKFLTNLNDNNLNDDYIYINKTNNKVMFIFNKEKKNHEAIKYEIDNQQLKDLLFYSYDTYPREFVISSIKNKDKPVTEYQKYNYFKMIDPRLGVNMLRSSYYSYNCSIYKNQNEIKNDAFKSRTSTNTIRSNYYKNN